MESETHTEQDRCAAPLVSQGGSLSHVIGVGEKMPTAGPDHLPGDSCSDSAGSSVLTSSCWCQDAMARHGTPLVGTDLLDTVPKWLQEIVAPA